MANCWETLELAPTHDFDEISKARRILIRKWHPDTVSDPKLVNEYTVRCATINTAYDEAVRIAEIRERVLRPATVNADFDAFEFRRSSIPSRPYTEAIYRYLYRGAFISVIYMLGFRYFVPATILAIIFAAGLVIAAMMDLIMYRYGVRPLLAFLGFQNPIVIPWVLLELANVVALANWFRDSHELFQAGVLLAIPLWRLKRWVRPVREQFGD